MNNRFLTHLSVIILLLCGSSRLYAQRASVGEIRVYHIYGYVYEQGNGNKLPLPYAVIGVPDNGVSAVANGQGRYDIGSITEGRARVTVSFLGKIPIDTVIHVTGDMRLDFTMQEDNFRIKEIVVTAENRRSGQSTASLITRTAMDHMQATSLADVMRLLPGELTRNPSLSDPLQLSIRSTTSQDMIGLGTAIIVDDAPLSNNANLQTMHPVVVGSVAGLYKDVPFGGPDARQISTDNIESVEVIRGIPSVQYGELTSGAVLVRYRAGREPLWVRVKANPNVYQFSAGKGFHLGEKKGALNLSADYAHNTNSTTQSYLYYRRAMAKAKYSNDLFNNKWTTHTNLNFFYGNDIRRLNPDDEQMKRSSQGKDVGVSLNTNGTFRLNTGWLRNITYSASASYTAEDSWHSELHTSANAPYSMSVTDGAILSNRPGVDIYDTGGNKITNIPAEDRDKYASYLPASYQGRDQIYGRELNLFYKVNATFFKTLGNTHHRVVVGSDGRLDKNYGRGKVFTPEAPPYRELQAMNATFRPRSYRDIPAVRQLGLYAEENLRYSFAGRDLHLQAGIRYDDYSAVKGLFTSRFNASLDVIPDIFTLRAGFGEMAKGPTQLYLYPEQAYFEYVNINEMANSSIPEDERVYVTTTKVYDTQNNELEVAKNTRKEAGFDLTLGKARLSVVAFDDKIKNGYTMSRTVNTFQPFTFDQYRRAGDGSQPVFERVSSNPVLTGYYTPTNNQVIETKGIEYDLDLGRIDAIRTSFNLNGAWMRGLTYNKDWFFFDDYSGIGATDRTHVGLYEKGMQKQYNEGHISALRITHNIPELGFVITLVTEAIWQDSKWFSFGNDSIPVQYISKVDGQVYPFDPAQKDEDEFTGIIRTVDERLRIKEYLSSPVFCFNLYLTKEIRDNMRLSFFANNLFSSYPKRESQRYPRQYYTYNKRFFFGLELSLKL